MGIGTTLKPLPASSEPVVDADDAVVDAHHHLWTKPEGTYLYPELLADLATGHAVRATVFVEGGSLHRPIGAGGTMYRADGPDLMKPVGESEFANGVGAMAASGLFGATLACAGVVGFVDLTAGDAATPVLDAHMRMPRFRGVRHITAWDDDPRLRNPVLHTRRGLLADDGFRLGLRQLARRGLSFETTAFHTQLAEIRDAARAVPDLAIIVCHTGYPIGVGRYAGRPRETFAEWHAGIRDLAACPNVTMKLGGLLSPRCALTPATDDGRLSSSRLAEAWRPFVDASIAAFGPGRCMFESNFPVDGRFVDYRTLWNAFKLLARAYSVDERRRLLAGTAQAAYRLDL